MENFLAHVSRAVDLQHVGGLIFNRKTATAVSSTSSIYFLILSAKCQERIIILTIRAIRDIDYVAYAR